jgi:hypothetical protein
VVRHLGVFNGGDSITNFGYLGFETTLPGVDLVLVRAATWPTVAWPATIQFFLQLVVRPTIQLGTAPCLEVEVPIS